MAGGIIFGLALAFLIEIRDSSFHSEKGLIQSFALPMVLKPAFGAHTRRTPRMPLEDKDRMDSWLRDDPDDVRRRVLCLPGTARSMTTSRKRRGNRAS